MSDFVLHTQLAKDCIVLGEFDLSVVLLMNDKQYPWFILVPKKSEIQEIYQLSTAEQQLLLQESSRFAKAIQTVFNADKLNIAALGNIVPQLHLHHIVRFKNDAAWPGPVWGVHAPQAYSATERDILIDKLKQASIAGLVFKA